VLERAFSSKHYTSLLPGRRGPPDPPPVGWRPAATSSWVSDISPYLVRGQGIEALRELATRYRLKYPRDLQPGRFVDREPLNRGGAGSALSLVGIPFAPAYTLEKAGLLEATLMDVRTGTFLFTTQVHIAASRRSTPWVPGAQARGPWSSRPRSRRQPVSPRASWRSAVGWFSYGSASQPSPAPPSTYLRRDRTTRRRRRGSEPDRGVPLRGPPDLARRSPRHRCSRGRVSCCRPAGLHVLCDGKFHAHAGPAGTERPGAAGSWRK